MQTAKPVTKPTKQRKMLYNAPSHIRHKLLAAHLSPELRASHLLKSLPVRSGDTVRVMRGDHKGFEGKITRTDLKNYRVYVEGLTREKVDGTTIFVPVHPSKIMVTHFNLDDKWRKNIVERKQAVRKKPRAITEKPKAEPQEKPPMVKEAQVSLEEKAAARKKPARKRAARRKAKEQPVLGHVQVETGAVGKEEKEKVTKKRTKAKTAKKTEKGEE
jgi:large subunit ribosomal protein L24